MVVIRPTASLAKRMKIRYSDAKGLSSNRLGDWYATDIVIERRQYILCLSEHARLSLILAAAPYANFPIRIHAALEALLRAIGIPESTISSELAEMERVVISKTKDRSVLGSLNEARRMLSGDAKYRGFNHDDVSKETLRLADVPSSVLSWAFPSEAAWALFGLPNQKSTVRFP